VAVTHARPCLGDLLEEARVVLQSKIEPVVFGREAQQHAGWFPVLGDDNLFLPGLNQVLGEVVLDFGKCYLLHVCSPVSASH
jgi:hypothetical protein